MTEVLTAALAWHDAGYCVLPTRTDGSKAPDVPTWTAYQVVAPTRATVEAWFAGGRPGLGLLCGSISGNLEMLELEGRAVDEGAIAVLQDLVARSGLQDLWDRVTHGYSERTPSGGVHLLYKVDAPVPGNTKLANRSARDDELTDAERAVVERQPHRVIARGLAETRGEGGYVVIAPSQGSTHPTGLPWVTWYGGPASVPTITAGEREQLHRLFRCLDTMPLPEPPPPRALQVVRDTSGGTSPGDDFEAKVGWDDEVLLGGGGWTFAFARGHTSYWRRPGKDTPGFSATTGHDASRDRLYVFSSSTEFDTETPYTKFGAYALLHHNSDFKAAAKELRRLGYGTPMPQLADPPPVIPTGPAQGSVDGATVRVLAEPAPGPEKFGATQDGLARALVATYGHELRYCPQRGKWLHWNGHRWLWDDAERHREMARELARQLPSGEGWTKFKGAALSAQGVGGIIRLAQSDAQISVHMEDLDSRPYELNTPAGIIDLRTGLLRAPDPAAMHTRSTAVAPDFDRRSEIFETFLTDTFADPDLIAYVQRLMGVSAIGKVLEQLLPFCFGSGANGKSTLLEAGMHVLGFGETGYAMAAPSEMLMIRKHNEHPAELAQLSGARLVVCSELESGQRFAEAKVKQLTGRDSINARFMRRDPFTFTPSHTLWLLGNHKPAVKAGGPAFWRRVRLLPFTQVVDEGRRDAKLGEKLAEDAPAILAWMARGAADYETAGMREPAVVKTATAAYASDQETVARFIDDRCHLAPGQDLVRANRDELRQAYEDWCREGGDEPVGAKDFIQEIRNRCHSEGMTRGRRWFSGIALLATDDEEPSEGSKEWYR